MAAYPLKVSFLLPLTLRQALWAKRLLEACEHAQANGGARDEDKDLRQEMALVAGINGCAPGVNAKYDARAGNLWVYGKEDATPEVIATWLQMVIQRFGLDVTWGFEWGYDRIHAAKAAYGGGAAIVNRDQIELLTTGDWLREKLQQMDAILSQPD